MAQIDLLEQVYMGNTEVISSLMNRQLSAQGMIVAVDRLDDCMLIAITDLSRSLNGSKKIPNRKALGSMIQKWLIKIGVSNVSKVQVSLKKSQQSAPIWTDEFVLSPSLSPDSTAIDTEDALDLPPVHLLPKAQKQAPPISLADSSSKINAKVDADHKASSEFLLNSVLSTPTQNGGTYIKFSSDSVISPKVTASLPDTPINLNGKSNNGFGNHLLTPPLASPQVGLLENDLLDNPEMEPPLQPLPALPPVTPLTVLGFHTGKHHPPHPAIDRINGNGSLSLVSDRVADQVVTQISDSKKKPVGFFQAFSDAIVHTPSLPIQIFQCAVASLLIVTLIPSIHFLTGSSTVSSPIKNGSPKPLWHMLKNNISTVYIPQKLGKHS
jgi:hypothetical protein